MNEPDQNLASDPVPQPCKVEQTVPILEPNPPEPENQKPFPYFHSLALAALIGSAVWFWVGGGMNQEQEPQTKTQPEPTQSSIEESRAPDLFFPPKGKEVTPVDETVPLLAKEGDFPAEVVSPAPELDPATLLFGVVSRIRDSREEP